jgi:hypothetical protein
MEAEQIPRFKCNNNDSIDNGININYTPSINEAQDE